MKRNRKIILGSGSPRRKQLLQVLFNKAEVRVKNVEEHFPIDLTGPDIPLYLAEQKANAFEGEISEDDILVTADTIVWFDEHVLNKPADSADALVMLNK